MKEGISIRTDSLVSPELSRRGSSPPKKVRSKNLSLDYAVAARTMKSSDSSDDSPYRRSAIRGIEHSTVSVSRLVEFAWTSSPADLHLH